MSISLMEGQAVEVASFNGIKIFNVKTAKFKTNSINIFIHDMLSKENGAKNALLPAVLRRGCKRFPSIKDMSLYLEDLYGANFDCGVTKKGEHQVVQFYLDYVSDKYVNSEGISEKAFELLFEIITNPIIESEAFRKNYFEQEIKNLKEMIESRVNDKNQYAVDRCFEEMCKDEPFGIYDYGHVEDLKEITSQNLYQHYIKFIETFPMYVYISGNVDDSKIKYIIDKLSTIKRSQVKQIHPGKYDITPSQTKEITEEMNISQSKLSIGFRTKTLSSHEDYYKLLVYNSILGGGLHSKLFQNVREKAGLAYYVFSRLEKFKGLMVISCGIENTNKDKCLKIIFEQMEEIKKGNISDYEFEAAIKSIETGIQSIKDSQLQVVDFYLSQLMAGTNDHPDTIVEKVHNVSKDDIVKVSQKILIDTLYFLTSVAN